MPATFTSSRIGNIPPSVHAIVILPQSRSLLGNNAPQVERVETRPAALDRLLALHAVLRGDDEARLVPLRARARLPARRAQVAELVPAAARHVVAPVRELDEVPAAGAALPARLTSECEHTRVVCSSAEHRERVRRRLAVPAGLRPAFGACEVPRGGRRGADEGGAGGAVAVDPVFGAELDRLLVDERGEGAVEVWANCS